MKNITLAIEETVLRGARRYAAARDTTVNGLVREYLTRIATKDDRVAKARERLLKLIDELPGRLGPDWKWNREDAYEGRVFPRHKHTPVRRAGKGR